MANWYVNFGNGSTTGYYAVLQWAVSTAYVVGNIRRQLATPAVGSERCFRCTTAGTSGGTEPSWNFNKGGTTADNTVVWTEVTGNEAYQAAGAWGAPIARLNTATTLYAAAGDTVFVASNHAETQTTNMFIQTSGLATNPVSIYCVDESGTGHVPPISADIKTTATVSVTGSGVILLDSGWTYCRGVIFNSGSGASSISARIGSYGDGWILEDCAFRNLATGLGGLIVIGNTSPATTLVYLKNTTLQFGHEAQAARILSARFIWENTPSAITGASTPTGNLFDAGSIGAGDVLIDGVDFFSVTSGVLISGAASPRRFFFKDCKFASTVSVASVIPSANGTEVYVTRSDSSGTNYRNEKYQYMGTQTVSTSIIRTNGASDGTTGVAWKLTTTANSKWILPFSALPIAIWNNTTAADVAATIEGVWNAAALPNNDDFWFDMEYLGSATSPQGSFKTGTKADGLAAGTALAASTQAWDSQVTIRANATAYTLGQVMKVTSNAGRIFFCTTAGTSSGSEPAGYASAVDGGSVTDGTAVFRAAVRFKLTVTMTSPQPAQVGTVYAYCKAAKASSTFYIDPKITLA